MGEAVLGRSRGVKDFSCGICDCRETREELQDRGLVASEATETARNAGRASLHCKGRSASTPGKALPGDIDEQLVGTEEIRTKDGLPDIRQ